MNTINNQNKFSIKNYLNEDFSENSSFLLQFCASEVHDKPLLFDHVNLALDYFDTEKIIISEPLVNELKAGYSYLTASIVCLDALIDNQPLGSNLTNPEIAKALSLLLVGSLNRFRNFATLAGIKDSKISSSINLLFSDLANALYEGEKNSKLISSMDIQSDREIIVNSARHVLFLFELVATACCKQVPQYICDAIKDFIYLTKLEDDLTDWKEDFISGRYNSSFLKECFIKFDHTPSIEELENLIYINGYYELWLSKIAIDFESVKDKLRISEKRESLLVKYTDTYQSGIKQRISEIIAEKRRYLETTT
ncbi:MULTISPECIES: hypothetical protein [Trichocoleus]|uniref:Uncharacterized protein n=1 Tax=Trichocoleus desertorum GB2-A4 TaxID=2933944 RepID=A0ABV0JH37_9CYAN|nr:hypothetical protein [Trichocoleus sp. FACHB-46]MBD1862324.1 hypothetical protein [Trichocoleus sp. FACHB-46]